MSTYETCRKCGCSPCECKYLTVAGWKCRREPEGPRLRWWDWVEFVAVSVLVWIVIVRPPLPGVPDA